MKPPKTTRQPIDTEAYGCRVTGTAVFGDWEGDPDVVGGINPLDPYIEDLEVTPLTDEDTPVTDNLMDLCYEAAMEAVAAMDGDASLPDYERARAALEGEKDGG